MKKEYNWFLTAFLVRLFFLLLIIYFSDILGTELNINAPNPDDRRYEAGAIYYSQNADSLIDVETFTEAYEQLNDFIGSHLNNWFEYTPLWYWIACIVLYIFKSIWALRILNITFASLSVVYIYKFARLISTEKLANRAAGLLALLPYPLMFSCFAYKDQFVMLCFLYLLYHSTYIRNNKKISHLIWRVVKIALVALILLFMRGGVGAVYCMFILANAIGLNKMIGFKIKKKYWGIILVIIIIGCLALAKSYSLIWYKLSYYFDRQNNMLEDTTIKFLLINSISDIYKLPFTYIFSIVMPIGMFNGINSWYDIISNVNIVMVPIAIGAAMYTVKRDKADKFIYWCMMFIYIMSVVASLNIFRHYYSLIPITLLAFADFTLKANKTQKLILWIGSGVMALMLVLYYSI